MLFGFQTTALDVFRSRCREGVHGTTLGVFRDHSESYPPVNYVFSRSLTAIISLRPSLTNRKRSVYETNGKLRNDMGTPKQMDAPESERLKRNERAPNA